MSEAKNMTATEVLAAEKAWAKDAAERASNPAEALINEMYRILKEKGLLTTDEG